MLKFIFNGFHRTPVFADDILVGEAGEGEDVKPPEKSFWAKYVSSNDLNNYSL